jgi:hypothetical protein
MRSNSDDWKVLCNHISMSSSNQLPGLARGDEQLERLAYQGYVTNYVTKLGTFGGEYATECATPFLHLLGWPLDQRLDQRTHNLLGTHLYRVLSTTCGGTKRH